MLAYLDIKKIYIGGRPYGDKEKVSIIIVTFNALDYVINCIESLEKTKYKNKEVIIIDNNSNSELKNYLIKAKKENKIDILHFSKINTFFSGGNNLGAIKASRNSKYLIFLNSDTEIRNPYWLNILMKNKPKEGIISFGKTDIPVIRPDGWCMMVDKKIYKYLGGLNEEFKMDWGITEFTAKVLNQGYEVKSIINPNNFVYHFGQKSRLKKRSKEHKKMSFNEVIHLFKGKKISLLKIVD